MFQRPLALRRFSTARPVLLRFRARKPPRRLRTRWLGSYVSRGPARTCVARSAGCADILGARSSAPGGSGGAGARAAVVDAGVGGACASCGRRAESRESGRAGWRLWVLVGMGWWREGLEGGLLRWCGGVEGAQRAGEGGGSACGEAYWPAETA